MTFASSDDLLEWKTKVEEIKATIAQINEDHPDDSVPSSRESLRHRSESWVRLVEDFAANYGKHKVPQDIRNAMHEVQGYWMLPSMDFGPDNGVFDAPDREGRPRPSMLYVTGSLN